MGKSIPMSQLLLRKGKLYSSVACKNFTISQFQRTLPFPKETSTLYRAIVDSVDVGG